MNKLHIVSFDVPFPPNYGGIIDVFYKIKELHKLGIEIYLHSFFDGQNKQPELNKYCKEVYYYKRGNTIISCLSLLPFRVKSRANKQLFKNINNNKAPVLYEGLHSAYLLTKKTPYKTYIRAHNIEHTYFYGLAKSEKNVFKKIFFFSEALKLSFFEKKITKAHGIFSISKLEQKYFLKNYGENATYIPAFHDNSFQSHKNSKGTYILWHGDLRVCDNIKAVLFLIDIYSNTKFTFKIASSTTPSSIIKALKRVKNIQFIKLNSNDMLNDLLKNAHINILYTYQNTGIKLKLLNALYKGKFVIGNNHLIKDTGLESICELANTKDEFLQKTNILFQQEFTFKISEQRKALLENFNPTKAAKKIVSTIFKH